MTDSHHLKRSAVVEALELGVDTALKSSSLTAPRLSRESYGELVALDLIAACLGFEEVGVVIKGYLKADREGGIQDLQLQAWADHGVHP